MRDLRDAACEALAVCVRRSSGGVAAVRDGPAAAADETAPASSSIDMLRLRSADELLMVSSRLARAPLSAAACAASAWSSSHSGALAWPLEGEAMLVLC